MLREFTRAFRPIAAAGSTARAVALSATVLALLGACGIKGPLKPAPSAPAATSVPQNPDTILVKPPDQPAVTAPPPIPPPVKP
jgi:hypothetical protein